MHIILSAVSNIHHNRRHTMAARKTTSVSTLVNDVHSLVAYAKVNERTDLLKAVAPLYVQTTEFVATYQKLRSEVDALVKAFLPKTETVDVKAFMAGVLSEEGENN